MLTTDIGPVIRPDFYSHHAAAAQTALIDRVVGDSSNNNNNNPALAISQSPRLGFTPSSKCSGAGAGAGAGAMAAATKLFGDNEILEHPGLRGTPLAMLAAQCNKLSSKSPPPLADAAVGKGFHPWKKSSLLGSITSSASSGGNAAAVVSTTSSSNNNSIQSYSNSSSSSPHSQQHQLQRGLTNSSSGGGSGAYGSSGGRTSGQCGSTGASAGGGYGTDLYFHGSGNSVGCGEQSPPGFIGKVDAGVYSRVAAYDSWPFNAMAGAHSAIKPDVSSMNGSSWWDAVHGVAAGTGWLDGSAAAVSAGMHHHHHHHAHHHQMSNYNDYSSLTHTLAAASHPNILNAGQHLLQDTYKSMLPSQSVGSSVSSPFGLGQASLPQTVPSTRNQRRYTGRATCDCPNCQEAERLGPAGAHLRKKNIHSCHIPGCGKVYGKTSHLKAHLRWHTVKSPTTKPKPETTTTNNSPSPNSVVQSSSSSAANAAARLKKPRKK